MSTSMYDAQAIDFGLYAVRVTGNHWEIVAPRIATRAAQHGVGALQFCLNEKRMNVLRHLVQGSEHG